MKKNYQNFTKSKKKSLYDPIDDNRKIILTTTKLTRITYMGLNAIKNKKIRKPHNWEKLFFLKKKNIGTPNYVYFLSITT